MGSEMCIRDRDKDVKNIMSKVSKSDLEPEEAVNLIFKLFKKNF